MSYQCPTCGEWRSCWSPSIHRLPEQAPTPVKTETPSDFARRCAENARLAMMFDVAEHFEKVAKELEKP